MNKDTEQEIAIISAWTEHDRIIGLSTMGEHGSIPWYIPEDMKRYRELTKDASMITGRETFFSIPEKFRPLKGRENIVVSTTLKHEHLREEDSTIIIVPSIEEALRIASRPKIFFNGGQGIYEEGMRYANTIYGTIVRYGGTGDRFFPKIGKEWESVENKMVHDFIISESGTPYLFATFRKVHKELV